jgi:cytochrome o ubiquinol oxidase subunit IV
MSHPSAAHDSHPHDNHGHDDHHGEEHPHVSLRDYVIGFVLSVILTAIPFWLVMNNVIASASATAFVVLGFAAVQMVVHMIFFLHMNAKSEGGWNMLALIFHRRACGNPAGRLAVGDAQHEREHDADARYDRHGTLIVSAIAL